MRVMFCKDVVLPFTCLTIGTERREEEKGEQGFLHGTDVAHGLSVRIIIRGGTLTGGYGFGYVSDMYPSPF